MRLGDPTLMDEFVEFLSGAGFCVAVEGSDTVRVWLALREGRHRTEAELRVLLTVWLEIGLRIWRDLWPDADAVALVDAELARQAASG